MIHDLARSPVARLAAMRALALLVFLVPASLSNAAAPAGASTAVDARGGAPVAARAEVPSIVAAAQAAYDRGIALRRDDPNAARREFVAAAAGFAAALDDPSIHGESGALWYNLGNARLQAGDLGEAIAAYLEAQRLVPSDPRLAANLSAARARCQDRLPADRGRGIWSSAMAARNAISPATRLWAAIAANALFWTLLAVRRVRLVPLAAIIAAGVATLLLGATVAVDMMVSRDRTQAVLVVDDAILRKGNGEGFDPAITARLGSGVELRVLEERPGWLRVRLPEGSEGWLRSEQVDRVDGVP